MKSNGCAGTGTLYARSWAKNGYRIRTCTDQSKNGRLVMPGTPKKKFAKCSANKQND
jgi:hypothetical protein